MVDERIIIMKVNIREIAPTEIFDFLSCRFMKVSTKGLEIPGVDMDSVAVCLDNGRLIYFPEMSLQELRKRVLEAIR